MVIGIDASNLRAGGGVTHLIEILRAMDPLENGFKKVIVWGGTETLSKIDERYWLDKQQDTLLNRSLPFRVFWQRFRLKRLAKASSCDVLFVPGGSDASGFRPMITMSRNMLPFEWKELFRFGISLKAVKLILLRFAQLRTFRKADGLIFLTQYAHDAVLKAAGKMRADIAIVPHGISPRFFIPPRAQRANADFTNELPCCIIYVSIVDAYKHQWQVVKAVDVLRLEGLPVCLDLIGPPASGTPQLEKAISEMHSGSDAIKYKGSVPYKELHAVYESADICVFASSCENMPNILLEGMAAGLPIAASSLGPMPEILGEAGLYFNPEDPYSIANAVRKLIESKELRTQLALAAYQRAHAFSWKKCASETIAFLSHVALKKTTFTDQPNHKQTI